MSLFPDATLPEIEEAMRAAEEAFQQYQHTTPAQRRDFLQVVADLLEAAGDDLLQVAMRETHLPEARLRAERGRTAFQLRQYGQAAASGLHLDLRIDTANADRIPQKPDLRKMMVPLGPVVVFGASNFPFAYSTAGGDTASALAVGCPVVVKAHPAHPATSQAVAELVLKAAGLTRMPDGVFQHLHGVDNRVGEALVTHPLTRAVGFTGSYRGGKALFDLAACRDTPIPVFAEMGSVNPIFALPGRMKAHAAELAVQYVASLTLGVGQFCTNPGIVVAIANDSMECWAEKLQTELENIPSGNMLHEGIARQYHEGVQAMMAQAGVARLAAGQNPAGEQQGQAMMARVSAASFLANPALMHEVFGPFALLVVCTDVHEMMAVANQFGGQLTCTIWALEEELERHSSLLHLLAGKCGRLLFNGVPTGVEVCDAMQHGGPFPATTDNRFSSVGADALRRFTRPLCFQNFPEPLLPLPLRNNNAEGWLRLINGKPSYDSL
jgi:NADP-dependent aldehyde dehydrogenase